MFARRVHREQERGVAGGTMDQAVLTLRLRSSRWLDRTRGALARDRAFRAAVQQGVVFDPDADVRIQDRADEEMNTVEAFTQRQKIRRLPRVVQALDALWSVVLRAEHRQYGGGENAAVPSIGFDIYSAYYHIVYFTLLPDEYDADAADEAAQEEWAEETEEGVRMDQAAFCKSLFECASC